MPVFSFHLLKTHMRKRFCFSGVETHIEYVCFVGIPARQGICAVIVGG